MWYILPLIVTLLRKVRVAIVANETANRRFFSPATVDDRFCSYDPARQNGVRCTRGEYALADVEFHVDYAGRRLSAIPAYKKCPAADPLEFSSTTGCFLAFSRPFTEKLRYAIDRLGVNVAQYLMS